LIHAILQVLGAIGEVVFSIPNAFLASAEAVADLAGAEAKADASAKAGERTGSVRTTGAAGIDSTVADVPRADAWPIGDIRIDAFASADAGA
jgi:hypothetical protein